MSLNQKIQNVVDNEIISHAFVTYTSGSDNSREIVNVDRIRNFDCAKKEDFRDAGKAAYLVEWFNEEEEKWSLHEAVIHYVGCKCDLKIFIYYRKFVTFECKRDHSWFPHTVSFFLELLKYKKFYFHILSTFYSILLLYIQTIFVFFIFLFFLLKCHFSVPYPFYTHILGKVINILR